MIIISSLTDGSKVFLVGEDDKKSFYYDLKKNYFINWAETNELHEKPALIKINDFIYLFDGFKQSSLCFERTNLTQNIKKWEKVVPIFEQNQILYFPTKYFATSLDKNGNVIFLGGDKVTLENSNSFIYNSKNNQLTLSIKGTNDNMVFNDKNFYNINNKYNVALPHRLNEIKEIASFDKDEQSLLKLSIEIPIVSSEYNYQYVDYGQPNYSNYSYYNNKTYGLCDNCKNSYKPNKYNTNTNININKNKNVEMQYEPYSQYSHPQIKNRNLDEYNENTEIKVKNVQNVVIKEEPKEFGYYICSNSSEEVIKKARKENIKMVTITKKYVPIKIGQRTTTKVDRRKDNIKIIYGQNNQNKNKTDNVKISDKKNQQVKNVDTKCKIEIIPSLNQEINLEQSYKTNVNQQNITNKKTEDVEKSPKTQNYEQYQQKSQTQTQTQNQYDNINQENDKYYNNIIDTNDLYQKGNEQNIQQGEQQQNMEQAQYQQDLGKEYQQVEQQNIPQEQYQLEDQQYEQQEQQNYEQQEKYQQEEQYKEEGQQYVSQEEQTDGLQQYIE